MTIPYAYCTVDSLVPNGGATVLMFHRKSSSEVKEQLTESVFSTKLVCGKRSPFNTSMVLYTVQS